MIFAVFDTRLLTKQINCSFYHLYLLCYFITNYSTLHQWLLTQGCATAPPVIGLVNGNPSFLTPHRIDVP